MIRIALLCASLALTGCATTSKFQTYDGPAVTQIYVSKERRKLYLLHDAAVLREYPISLGFAPAGHKAQKGDGRTPEGFYVIDRKNPRSSYHLSIGISYPNSKDRALAEAMGVSPGGDIFIHGESDDGDKGDWTAGCIAVSDEQMEEIYAMVQTGTPIYITP